MEAVIRRKFRTIRAEDAGADRLGPLLSSTEANVHTGEKSAFSPQPLLAEGKVRYVGEPVALIVAETRAQALDAAELVAVDYAPLPAGFYIPSLPLIARVQLVTQRELRVLDLD